MTKRLILHIGQPKTGTTTLQKTLQASRSALINDGILYPNTGKNPNHIVILPHLTGDSTAGQTPASNPQKFDPLKVMKLSNEKWSDLTESVNILNPNTIIISSEQLFRTRKNKARESLKNHLKSISSEIIITAYLREPASSALSRAQQLLKSQPNFNLPHKDCFRRILEPYVKSDLGIVSTRIFDRKNLEKGDIVADFCTHYIPDFDQSRLSYCTETNTTMSAEAMALMQELNRKERTHPSIKALKKTIGSIDKKIEGFSRPQLHDHVRLAIQNRCTDLDWLKDQFGIVFPSVDKKTMTPNKADNICEGLDRVKDICIVDTDRKAALWSALCNNRNYKRSFNRLLCRLLRKA